MTSARFLSFKSIPVTEANSARRSSNSPLFFVNRSANAIMQVMLNDEPTNHMLSIQYAFFPALNLRKCAECRMVFDRKIVCIIDCWHC